MALSVREVTAGYTREVPILKGVSLEARTGLVTVIIGPNGAGKSTLLNIINGFYAPNAGTITWKGRTARRMTPYRAASTGIAHTFQNIALFKGMSVLDNYADLPSAGVSFVVLKPWDQRSKAKGTDILSIAERLQNALNAAPTAGCSSCRRRRSRASAMPAACRCNSRCWAAASITSNSTKSRSSSSKGPRPIPNCSTF